MVRIHLVLKKTAKLSSKVDIPFCIPDNYLLKVIK